MWRFDAEEGPEEEAMRARPVYVAAVDLSCKFQIMLAWVLIDDDGGGGCEFQWGRECLDVAC